MPRKGTLTVRVVADTKAAEQGLDKFSTKVSSTGDKLQAAGKKMTLFATVPIAGAMGLATKAASDLQQAVGGTEAVFGEASDAIDDFADKSARATGLSEREFREATTSIGGQLKRMTGDVDLAAEQSIELTRVAADLAATYGGTTAEAVAALGSAFRGEADPAERFNLNLKVSAVNAKAVELGLAATTSEVDDNARAQATLALITEQSADAQGQFARENDSAAGSMQIARAEMEEASAEIGSNLLPLVADAAGGIADLAQKFGSLPEPLQKSILGLAGIVAAAGPITGAVGTVLTGLDKARTAAGKAGDAFETLQLRSLYLSQSFGGPAGLVAGLGAVGALVTTGAVLYGDYAATKAEARRITDLYVDALKSENDELDKNIDKVGASELANKDYATAIRESGVGFDVLVQGVRESGDALESLDDDLAGIRSGAFSLEEALERAGLSGSDFGDALLTLQGAMSAGDFNDLLNDLDGLSDRYDNATVKTRNHEAAERDVAAATGEAADAADDAKGPIADLGGAADDAKDPFDELEDSIRGVNDALQAQFDPLFGAQDALIRNQEAQWKAQEAANAVTEAQQNYNDVVAEFGRNSPEAVHAAHQIDHAERLLADANRDAARTALDVTTASNELARKLREGVIDVQASKEQIRQWADQGLITEEQARQMAAEIDKVSQEARELDGQTATLTLEADISDLVAGLEEATLRVMGFNQAHGTNIAPYRGPGVQVETAGEFDNGGIIPGPRGSRQLVVAHGGETVLPTHKPGSGTAGVVIQAGGSLVTLNGGDHDANSIAHHIASFLARR